MMARLRKKARLFADAVGKVIQISFWVLRTTTGPAMESTVETAGPAGTRDMTTISSARAQDVDDEDRERERCGRQRVRERSEDC